MDEIGIKTGAQDHYVPLVPLKRVCRTNNQRMSVSYAMGALGCDGSIQRLDMIAKGAENADGRRIFTCLLSEAVEKCRHIINLRGIDRRFFLSMTFDAVN